MKTAESLNKERPISRKLVVSFERIGRHRHVPPLEIREDDEIPEQIARYVRRFLMSKGFDVAVNLDEMCGVVGNNAHSFGTFTLSRV